MYLQKRFTQLGYRHGRFPTSERQADQPLAQSIDKEMTEAMIRSIVAALAVFVIRGRAKFDGCFGIRAYFAKGGIPSCVNRDLYLRLVQTSMQAWQ